MYIYKNKMKKTTPKTLPLRCVGAVDDGQWLQQQRIKFWFVYSFFVFLFLFYFLIVRRGFMVTCICMWCCVYICNAIATCIHRVHMYVCLSHYICTFAVRLVAHTHMWHINVCMYICICISYLIFGQKAVHFLWHFEWHHHLNLTFVIINVV